MGERGGIELGVLGMLGGERGGIELGVLGRFRRRKGRYTARGFG